MGGACSRVRREMPTEFWLGNLNERYKMEDVVMDGGCENES